MVFLGIQSVNEIRFLVRSERKRRHLTQVQVAGIMGHTQKWLSDFESGKVEPSVGMVLSLLMVLGQEISIVSKDLPPALPASGGEVELDEGEL